MTNQKAQFSSRWTLLRGALLICVPAALCAAACGAGDGRDGGGGGAGSGSGSTGNGTGSNGNGTGGIDLGSGGSGGGSVVLKDCDESTPCGADEVCVATSEGKGLCSPKGNDCTTDSDCQNDTYCCDGDCRLDGVAQGVCVLGDTRPTNSACTTAIAVGVFSPDSQCEWTKPPAGDPYPNSLNVLGTPLVANLPNESGTAAEIVFITSETGTGGGRLRIINGQSCEQREVIDEGPALADAATPAIADLDGDGKPEIIARKWAGGELNGGLVAFTWQTDHYGVMWEANAASAGNKSAWDGVSVHDLNDDGKPEIVGRYGEVHNGQTGAVIAAANSNIRLRSDPVVVDVDGDGTVELVANQVFSWNGSGWTKKYNGPNFTTDAASPVFYGVGDFGTRSSSGSFDHTQRDGRAEVVAVGALNLGSDEQSGMVGVYTLEGETLLRVDFAPHASCPGGQATGERGGPPTVGDFDGDGMPELATAGAFGYRVFDLACGDAGTSCADASKKILWEQKTQDCTSGMTGSTIFDFEGDGIAEAVYADECFVRVYNGQTGEVLFSTYRNSATWWEQPVVADPDNSDRSKLIFGGAALYNVFSGCGNSSSAMNCEAPTGQVAGTYGCIDPQWAGVRCTADDDCVSGACNEGYCRCQTNADCGNTWERAPNDWNDAYSGLICTSPKVGTPGSGNVCRTMFGNVTTTDVAKKWFAGVKVYRDKLDRWASSRAMWNQHAYAITNVNDDGTIPKTSDWKANHTAPDLNNFRQNRQGATSADLADITGALDAAKACTLVDGNKIRFTGRICNRGLRGVGAAMPATFYVADQEVCKTQTAGPVPVGSCSDISCDIALDDVPSNANIKMVVNDAGAGARITDECNYENNTATVKVVECVDPK